MLFPRKYSAPRLLRRLVQRHSELAHPCGWDELQVIATREGVRLRIVPFPAPIRAQILRFGGAVVIQIARRLSLHERTIAGFHELTHYWVDPSADLAFQADRPADNSLEEFCDIFAWYVTTTDRPNVR